MSLQDETIQDEMQQIEEADAWFEYLETTRRLRGRRYQEIEPWAGVRLDQRLRNAGCPTKQDKRKNRKDRRAAV